jgi:hypothetical protein
VGYTVTDGNLVCNLTLVVYYWLLTRFCDNCVSVPLRIGVLPLEYQVILRDLDEIPCGRDLVL